MPNRPEVIPGSIIANSEWWAGLRRALHRLDGWLRAVAAGAGIGYLYICNILITHILL
jgi:hypothetical protein